MAFWRGSHRKGCAITVPADTDDSMMGVLFKGSNLKPVILVPGLGFSHAQSQLIQFPLSSSADFGLRPAPAYTGIRLLMLKTDRPGFVCSNGFNAVFPPDLLEHTNLVSLPDGQRNLGSILIHDVVIGNVFIQQTTSPERLFIKSVIILLQLAMVGCMQKNEPLSGKRLHFHLICLILQADHFLADSEMEYPMQQRLRWAQSSRIRPFHPRQLMYQFAKAICFLPMCRDWKSG